MMQEPQAGATTDADEAEAPRALPAFLVRLTATARASTTASTRPRRSLGGHGVRDASEQRYRDAVLQADRLRNAV